ncbi:L,D-transpeptidase [Nocardioides caricicola]|uniref:L,D-transpeptidase n=1 Tax=Nocardioides caricicola TaxID=634770 RepID=A0ABW0N2U6_9ACTN
MSQHRGTPVRPRYGRLAVLGSSLAVTMIAVLGGTGVLPSTTGENGDGGAAAAVAPVAQPSETPSETPSPEIEQSEEPVVEEDLVEEDALPADSGTGRRIVFSESQQRVWLVTKRQQVERTYLVSGSLTDNLDPGTYSVYSRSEQAWGIDDSGTMKYFVRFTQGDTGAAIGFHTIPVDEGKAVQTVAQLGTPQSHGCIRQKLSDAIALWEFAPLGTTVVVTA